ncbi:MAG: hypothetical protein ABJO36_10160 [Litorimonas sp.]
MTHFKTILMTAALMAVPSVALAQVSTDAVKEKAVDSVMDNMTTDDAIIAGKTMIKGGSKEDAAKAVVKNRAEKKIESMTGGVSMDDVSKDGVMKAGKEMAEDKMMDKAKSSATTYTDKSKTHGMSDMEKAKAMITTGDVPIIQKSGAATPAATAPAVKAAPVNCPAGTKDAGDGTCMITGDWKP